MSKPVTKARKDATHQVVAVKRPSRTTKAKYKAAVSRRVHPSAETTSKGSDGRKAPGTRATTRSAKASTRKATKPAARTASKSSVTSKTSDVTRPVSRRQAYGVVYGHTQGTAVKLKPYDELGNPDEDDTLPRWYWLLVIVVVVFAVIGLITVVSWL